MTVKPAPSELKALSLFRADEIGTGLQIPVLRAFLTRTATRFVCERRLGRLLREKRKTG
ncbi:hypothetical protein I6F13_19915 [Bradyrhizobium sp. IC4061]|nr:hypothetical protein [Bradyrhizobium sp. IC4061]